jgi:serine/threonine protein kinase/Tol biopolymer transport system component
MADENWQRVRKIFDEALRQKPEERRNFVRRACGKNKTLLADVESLLESLDSADSFMEKPAIAGIAGQILSENLQFAAGQFLNHYEIIRHIGAGGMGEVYLAQDAKLNRRVALKVLHRNLSSDNQANHRLLREARAAATLDHPHICMIHEISEAGDCSFIVMQYVEGETLADILAKERLSIEKSLDLALQIADALAEAHARGVIHRDIKPANIIVNEKGQAKVLDFGLAKFITAETGSETVRRRLPSSGAVMGTVPFMSPEQLCGKPLDARTDIFSFGALVYEMLTGRPAFARENNAETISAILNDQPDLAEVPGILQPIVQKCLMKKSFERYQTAEDLRRDLLDARQSGSLSEKIERPKTKPAPTARLKQNSSQKALRPASKSPRLYFWKSSERMSRAAPASVRIGGKQTAATRRARLGGVAVPLSALAIFLAVAAAAASLVFWKLNEADDAVLADALRPQRVVSWKAAAGALFSDYRLSHDGKLIAYSSAREGGKENIYVKQTDGGEEIPVTKDEWRNVSPVWSPDDRRIAYSSIRENQAGIYASPVSGGASASAPLKIIGKGDVHLRHWSKDGAAIFYEYQGNLFRLDLATLETAQITDFPAEPAANRYFGIAPGEDRIAFCDTVNGQTDIWVMSLKGGEKLRLTDDKSEKSRLRWHADGRRILYNFERDNQQQIGAAYADGERSPVRITRGGGSYEMIDVSADGTKIFYSAVEDRSDIGGVKIESGEEFEIATTPEYEFWTDVSPDGKSIVFQTKNGTMLHESTIIVKALGNQSPAFELKGYNPRWLPDSRRISFLRRAEQEQKYHLWLADTASREVRQLTTIGVPTPSRGFLPSNRGEIGFEDFSPGGEKLVYVNNSSPKTVWNVWTVSLESAELVNLTKNENSNVKYHSPLFSADGKRIVFVSSEKFLETTIWRVLLAEQGKTKQIFSRAGGLRLLGWSAAGNEILLEMTNGAMKSTPLDVMLLRVSLAGDYQVVTTFKNIYADSMTLSRDARTLAFTARQNDKDDIWTFSIAGGEMKKITANGSDRLYYGSPAWSPDGKTIFFDRQEQIYTISTFENFK